MLSFARFSTRRSLDPQMTLKVIEGFQGLAEAVSKVAGVKSCKFYIGQGTFVLATEQESFGVTDAVLKDPDVQARFLPLIVDGGIYQEQLESFYHAQQLYPFITKS